MDFFCKRNGGKKKDLQSENEVKKGQEQFAGPSPCP